MTDTRKETAREVFERLIAEYPGRFVEAKPTGQGYIILGARPPTAKDKERRDDEPDGS
jgi:hypothetical protein